MMVRMVVVLPAPLRPRSTVTRSRRTASDTPWRMWCWPMSAWTSCSSRRTSDTGAAAEVGRLHFRIAGDRLRRVIGDETAVLEHGHGVGERHHHIDLVLDEQDGGVALRL